MTDFEHQRLGPAGNKDLRVYIIDPDLDNCEALSLLFRLEGYQTSFGRTAYELRVLMNKHMPHVIVAALDPDGNVTHAALGQHSAVCFVGLLEAPDVPATVAAVKAGAADVLVKPIDTERLLSVVARQMRREVEVRWGRVDPTIEIRGFHQLTHREREVLQLIVRAKSNKEVGRELGISPRTVEVHRARVMEKLRARNTADLMRIVLTS